LNSLLASCIDKSEAKKVTVKILSLHKLDLLEQQIVKMKDMTDEELKKHFFENEAAYKEYAELVEESEYMIDYGKKEILFGATAFHNFYLNMQIEEAKQLGITSIDQVDQHGILARFEEDIGVSPAFVKH
jgi:hypothetical protein